VHLSQFARHPVRRSKLALFTCRWFAVPRCATHFSPAHSACTSLPVVLPATHTHADAVRLYATAAARMRPVAVTGHTAARWFTLFAHCLHTRRAPAFLRRALFWFWLPQFHARGPLTFSSAWLRFPGIPHTCWTGFALHATAVFYMRFRTHGSALLDVPVTYIRGCCRILRTCSLPDLYLRLCVRHPAGLDARTPFLTHCAWVLPRAFCAAFATHLLPAPRLLPRACTLSRHHPVTHPIRRLFLQFARATCGFLRVSRTTPAVLFQFCWTLPLPRRMLTLHRHVLDTAVCCIPTTVSFAPHTGLRFLLRAAPVARAWFACTLPALPHRCKTIAPLLPGTDTAWIFAPHCTFYLWFVRLVSFICSAHLPFSLDLFSCTMPKVSGFVPALLTIPHAHSSGLLPPHTTRATAILDMVTHHCSSRFILPGLTLRDRTGSLHRTAGSYRGLV